MYGMHQMLAAFDSVLCASTQLSLSSRWWCLGPDDDSLIETDILTCMHVVIHSRDTPAGHRTAIQISCVESVLAFDGTILL